MLQTVSAPPRGPRPRPVIEYGSRCLRRPSTPPSQFWTWFLLPGEPVELPDHGPLPEREVRGCKGPRSPAYCVACSDRLISGQPRVRIREQQAVSWFCLDCGEGSPDPRIREASSHLRR